MTRTALSRVFGQFGDNIRVAWQTIWLLRQLRQRRFVQRRDQRRYDHHEPQRYAGRAAPRTIAQASYDWLFQVGANGTTPDRLATIRAGEFFKRRNTSNT